MLWCREQEVGENESVEETWLYGPLRGASKENSGKHTVCIEPVRIAVPLRVGKWVASVANVLAASEFLRYRSFKETVCERAFRCNWRKVAGEVRVDIFFLGSSSA